MVLGDVPRRWGGLGEEPEGSSKLWIRRYRFAKLSWGEEEKKWDELEESRLLVKYHGHTKVTVSGGEKRQIGVTVTGLVKRQWLADYAARRYRLRDLLEWSSSNVKYRSFQEKVRRIKVKENVVKKYNLTRVPEIEQAEMENWAFEHGYTPVERRTFYEPVEVRTHINGVPIDRFLPRQVRRREVEEGGGKEGN